MANDLTTPLTIPPPDVRRPEKLAMLPPWVRERCDALTPSAQPRKWALPASMLIASDQRAALENHLVALNGLLDMTPEADPEFAQQAFTTISKMLATLGGREAGELASEAKGEAYMMAIEDVPAWAVQEAARKWYRGELGDAYDYKWMPDPATLRKLALDRLYMCAHKPIREINALLTAVPAIEFSEDHKARMRQRFEELKVGDTVAIPPRVEVNMGKE